MHGVCSQKSSSSLPTTAANGVAPPPPAAAANGGSKSHPEDSLTTWLPNFVTGGSSHLAMNPNHIIYVATIFILFSSFNLFTSS